MRDREPVSPDPIELGSEPWARGGAVIDRADDHSSHERTVTEHLTAIVNKLGANSRAQSVAVTTERGLP